MVYLETLSQYLPGGTEKTTNILTQDSRCPSRDSNRALLECQSQSLSIIHLAVLCSDDILFLEERLFFRLNLESNSHTYKTTL
jgi:hypothetical protein